MRDLLDWEVGLRRRDAGRAVTEQLRSYGVNQPVFNRLVQRRVRRDQLSLKVLDVRKFPSGSIMFGHPKWVSRQSVQPVVVHTNFLIGAEAKKKMLLKYGLWYV